MGTKENATGVHSNIYIKLINNANDFYSLKDSWNELLSNSDDNNIFLTWEWQYYWWKHFGDDKDLNILLLENNDTIIGILPLMKSIVPMIPHHKIIENFPREISDYCGIIINKNELNTERIFDSVTQYLLENNIDCIFYNVPEKSVINKYIDYNAIFNYFYCSRQKGSMAKYILLPETLEEFNSSFDSRFIKDLRKYERRLERNVGKINYIMASEKSLPDDLKEFWKLYENKLAYMKLNRVGDKLKSFYNELFVELQRRNWLHLSFIEVNGKKISVGLSFVYDNKYYAYIPAFDREYYSYSIGNIHILHTIEKLISDNIYEFDFLRGNEPYKDRWMPKHRNNINITLIKNSRMAKYKHAYIKNVYRLNTVIKYGIRDNYQLFRIRKRYQDIKNDKI